VVFLANPNPPRFDGQAKHKPFTRILVVMLQVGVDGEGRTQLPPCLVLIQVEGGMHPH
jgi:hypothetical protein